jgi:Zn-finger nucleic acid-binding protein
MNETKEELVCPNCQDVNLSKTQCEKELFVDYCKKCGGIWLDRGELTELASLSRFYINHLDSGGEAVIINRVRECPHCEVVLQPMHPREHPDITIDRCPDCKGMWLDRGELRQFARKS